MYVPVRAAAHGEVRLTPEQSHHIAHVLRLAVGDGIVAFDGSGSEADGIVEHISKSGVVLKVGAPVAVDRESPLAVVLAQGISSGERMDYTIQKAVELGVQAIQPLTTERSVVRLDADRAAKRVAHWQAVAVAACEQCGRNRVPVVAAVVPFTAWLGTLDTKLRRIVLSPHAERRLVEMERPDTTVVLLIGPEGGLSPREHDVAAVAGFTGMRLGPRVLRTETAAVATLAAMQALWGDF